MYPNGPFDLVVLHTAASIITFTRPFRPFSMKELEKDMAMLRNGMKEVGREVEFYRTQPPVNGDRYVTFNLFKKMSMSGQAHCNC